MGNASFDAAAAGGSVDTAVGFPKSREEMYEFYGFIRKQTRDAASVEGGELEFPAGYMFKDVPKWDAEAMDDPVQILLAELDRHNIRQAIVTPYDGPAERALREYPDRFFAGVNVDPNEGMEALRKIDKAARDYDLKCVHAFPAGLYPQVAINDEKFYPIYMKCVELDVPFCSTAGVPGPRIPYAPQDVAHIDEVCWFFPELKFVTRHGCEPWADLAVNAAPQVAQPLLLDHRVRAEVLPEGHHRLREHPRGRQGHLVGLLPRRSHLRPHLQRASRRSVPRSRVAQVPARERAARLQAPVTRL